jgi:phage gp46-like protein
MEQPLQNGLVPSDGGLRRAVAISLFTDARAKDDDTVPVGASKRGYWGDVAAPFQSDQWTTGSRLWLLAREKQTPETARRAEIYAKEALAWMILRGFVRAVSVFAEWVGSGILGLAVTLTLPDGTLLTERYKKVFQ